MIEYDEATRTVNNATPKAESVCTSDTGNCWRANVSDTEILVETFEGGEVSLRQEVDRMTGHFVYSEFSGGKRTGQWTGTCVKFKQAF